MLINRALFLEVLAMRHVQYSNIYISKQLFSSLVQLLMEYKIYFFDVSLIKGNIQE